MHVKSIFYLLIITTVFVSAKKSYEGYKVYKVIPKTQDDVKNLDDVQKSGIGEFWVEQFDVNHKVKIMVSSEKQSVFLERMKVINLEAEEVIADLQKVIDDQLKPVSDTSRDSSATFHSMSWDRYHNLEDINNWLDELVAAYPTIVTPISMGQSNENRTIRGVKISYRNNTRIGVMEGTLHAREWISPATVTWIIKEFLTSTNATVRALAQNFDWHMFPVVNPDGYEFTFTDNRMWRKNRNSNYSTTCAEGVDDGMSHGVDLNRNFGFQWMTVGASSDPCTNTFAGSSAFSEPESRAIASYVRTLETQGEIIYYLAFHSFTQLIVIPYSHISGINNLLLANNYADMETLGFHLISVSGDKTNMEAHFIWNPQITDELISMEGRTKAPDIYEIAIRGADKLKERFGTEYRVGISADVLYQMSGTSFDWVKHEADVPVCYLIELRDLGEYGFLLPPEQIIPNNLEIMDFLLEMDETTRILGYYTAAGAATVFGSFFVTLFGVTLAYMLL